MYIVYYIHIYMLLIYIYIKVHILYIIEIVSLIRIWLNLHGFSPPPPPNGNCLFPSKLKLFSPILKASILVSIDLPAIVKVL